MRKLSVLLVDANAVSGHVASQYLDSWGLAPDICSTVAAARRTWDARIASGVGYDVVIIDAKGLGEAGLNLAAKMRADRPRPGMEIIYLAGVDKFASETLDAHDAFATLSKPVRPSELYDCLASIAGGAGSPRASALFTKRGRARSARFNARILVAEDNAVNQDVVMGMLDNMGCRVVTVPNGRAAVQAVAQDHFDLILMDCEMPEMDGFQATRRIREIERLTNELPEHRANPRHIPIIAVTAHALAEMRDKCLAAGMDDFITKPFDDLQLAEALRRRLTPTGASAASDAPSLAIAKSSGNVSAAETVEPLNPTALNQIKTIEARGSKGLLQRVVTKFTDTAPGMAAEMKAKFATRDGEALWRAAHGLKSAASAVGAAQVSLRCNEIETLVRRSGPEAAAELIDALDAELAIAIKSLQAFLTDADAAVH